MRMKFKGPANPDSSGEDQGHNVVAAGCSLGTVRPGDVLDVPDDLDTVWPAELWELVTDRSKTKKGDE